LAPSSTKNNEGRILAFFEKAHPLIQSYLRLLRPSAHTRIAWFVVVAGIGIASTPLWAALLGSILVDTLGISVPTVSPWIGVFLVLIGLGYHLLFQMAHKDRSIAENAAEKENLDHDYHLIQELASMCNESFVTNLFDNLMTDDLYLSSQFHGLQKVSSFIAAESNSLLTAELNQSAENFLDATTKLRRYLAYNFFDHPYRDELQGEKFRVLYPDLNPDLSDSSLAMDGKRYREAQEQLDEHTRRFHDSFKEFIGVIKLKYKEKFFDLGFQPTTH
jgi:hypothetical protein